MDKASRFPLDFDALKKGDVISKEVIERYQEHAMLGKFDLAAMRLVTLIERAFARRGVDVMVRRRQETLYLLLDHEALIAAPNRFHNKKLGMYRAHKKTLGIDRTQLTDQQKQEHERVIINNGKIALAVAEAESRQSRQRCLLAALGLPAATTQEVQRVSDALVSDRRNGPASPEERADSRPAQPLRAADEGDKQVA